MRDMSTDAAGHGQRLTRLKQRSAIHTDQHDSDVGQIARKPGFMRVIGILLLAALATVLAISLAVHAIKLYFHLSVLWRAAHPGAHAAAASAIQLGMGSLLH